MELGELLDLDWALSRSGRWTGSRNGHGLFVGELDLISRWTVTEAGAADHVEELAAVIGDDGTG
ncbi:hypothetical protein ACIRDS_32725, partial [Streptomyces sp. NPDC093992]